MFFFSFLKRAAWFQSNFHLEKTNKKLVPGIGLSALYINNARKNISRSNVDEKILLFVASQWYLASNPKQETRQTTITMKQAELL
jgi:hypothetical protein